MIEIDLDRALDDAHEPSLPIAGRFTALGQYIEVLEEFVPQIQDQLLVRSKARIEAALAYNASDVAVEEIENAKWMVLDLVPSNAYGPLVFSVSAMLEESMFIVLRYIERLQKEFKTRRKSGGSLSTFEHLTSELERGLGGPLQVGAKTFMALEQLQQVRNLLAHANGAMAGLSKERKARIEGVVGAGVGVYVHEGILRVKPEFVRHSFEEAELFMNAVLHHLSVAFPR